MKNTLILILALLGLLGIFAHLICNKQNDTIVRMGVNIDIIEINDTDKTMIVFYEDKQNNVSMEFKVDCNIAIDQHKIIYCDYRTHIIREISFDSLCVGDDLILSMDDAEFLQLQNGDTIQALQIQLATQRLE